MQSFPKLKEGQVALMRADSLKGYVLDEAFVVATDDRQIVYTVVNDFENATLLANQIINEQINVECVIYDSNQKTLSFLRQTKIKEK